MTPSFSAEQDQARLSALRSYHILDTASEQDYDELTELAAAICGTPISLISLVDGDRQWFKSSKGILATETDISLSFCAHAIATPGELMQVENAHFDDRFKDNPLVTGDPHITFYAGVPLVDQDGHALGSICVVDHVPRVLTELQQRALKTLSKQVINKLSLRRKVLDLEAARIENLALIDKCLQSERNTRNIIEQSPVALIVFKGPKLLIDAVNPAMLEILQQEPDITGQPLLAAIPELANQPAFNLLNDVYETGKTIYGYDTPVQLKRNGVTGTGYFNFTYTPLMDDGEIVGVIDMAVEVSDQYNARQALQESKHRLTAINADLNELNMNQAAANQEHVTLNEQLIASKEQLVAMNTLLHISEERLHLAIASANLGTWYVNMDSKEFIPSLRLKELFGYSPEETMPYEAVIEQIADSHRVQIQEAVEAAIREGHAYDLEYPISGYQDQKPRWVRATGKRYRSTLGDQSGYFTGTIQDITERKLDEQRRSDFIGMVSHELRTPLTTMNGYVQVLNLKAKKSGDVAVGDIAEKTLRQVEKMKTLVSGFLDVARSGEGKIQLNKQYFDVAELMRVTEAESLATISSHPILYYPAERVLVYADRDKIEQIMVNLISNAVKYSIFGSTIFVKCSDAEGRMRVTVTDQGMGIPVKDQPYVFNRFYRVEGEQTKMVRGFGIGLYICREIVECHGGQIGLESVEGKGSTFWFELPTADESDIDKYNS